MEQKDREVKMAYHHAYQTSIWAYKVMESESGKEGVQEKMDYLLSKYSEYFGLSISEAKKELENLNNKKEEKDGIIKKEKED